MLCYLIPQIVYSVVPPRTGGCGLNTNVGTYEAPSERIIIPSFHPIIMMGCHFQDLPCKASLCLRGLHSCQDRPPFLMCDESTVTSCPHRAWDHQTHLEVCRKRAESTDRCQGCGGRHRTMIEALHCELASSVQRSFLEEGVGGGDPMGERAALAMRASAWRMIRRGVIARDGGRCRICGKDLSRVPSWLTEVHHVQPRSEGGSDHPSNLITLCIMCHRRITTDAILTVDRGSRFSSSDEFLPRECLEALR